MSKVESPKLDVIARGKSKIEFFETVLGGGKWAWCLWVKVSSVGGWAVVTSAYGFDTLEHAKEGWKVVKEQVNNAREQVRLK